MEILFNSSFRLKNIIFSIQNSDRFDRIVRHYCSRFRLENVRRNIKSIRKIGNYETRSCQKNECYERHFASCTIGKKYILDVFVLSGMFHLKKKYIYIKEILYTYMYHYCMIRELSNYLLYALVRIYMSLFKSLIRYFIDFSIDIYL